MENNENSIKAKKYTILKKPPNTYNKKAEFTKDIQPVIKELKKICNLHKMPMFVSVAVANDDEKTEYEHDIIMASTEIKLTDNRLSALLLKLNGFEEQLPEYIQNDVREINEYLTRLNVGDEDRIDIELAQDFIGEELKIVAGGDKVVAPTNLTTKAISKEEASALDDYQDEAIHLGKEKKASN